MKKKHFVIIRKNRYLFANELLLTDGGILIFDVFSEGIIDDRQESRDWEYAPCGGFWNESEYLLLSQTFHHLGKVLFGGRNNKYIEKGRIS